MIELFEHTVAERAQCAATEKKKTHAKRKPTKILNATKYTLCKYSQSN